MDSIPLTRPIERLLLTLTLAAFLSVVYWNAAHKPSSRLPSPLEHPL